MPEAVHLPTLSFLSLFNCKNKNKQTNKTGGKNLLVKRITCTLILLGMEPGLPSSEKITCVSFWSLLHSALTLIFHEDVVLG